MSSLKHFLAPAATLFVLASILPATAQDAIPSPGQDDLWQTRCAGTSRSSDELICEATQSVRVKESGQLLFKVDIIYPANDAPPVLQMQLPLGFYIPGKIKLSVDGIPIDELDVGTCDTRGCFLSSKATPVMIDAMKAGAKLKVDFAPSAGNRQAVEIPLTGFSRAMAAIQ